LKILFIRAGALGDTLMLMPSINSLRNGHEIIIAGRRPAIDYIQPYVDRCVDIESSGCHRLFMTDTVGPLDLSLPPPDHVVAFLNDTQGMVLTNLKTCFPNSAVSIFPVFPPEGDDRHIALYMAQAIRETGLPINASDVFGDSFQHPIMAPEDSLSGETGPVVIHPGSGSQKKNYPPLFWLQLIREMRKKVLGDSRRIVMLFGPAEEGVVALFRNELREKDVELKVLPDKEELISILSKASVYIGHDSGVTHLAAMLGRPVIAIFKESSIERWRPLGTKVRIIRNGEFHEK
jgi:heptosyltransferase III